MRRDPALDEIRRGCRGRLRLGDAFGVLERRRGLVVVLSRGLEALGRDRRARRRRRFGRRRARGASGRRIPLGWHPADGRPTRQRVDQRLQLRVEVRGALEGDARGREVRAPRRRVVGRGPDVSPGDARGVAVATRPTSDRPHPPRPVGVRGHLDVRDRGSRRRPRRTSHRPLRSEHRESVLQMGRPLVRSSALPAMRPDFESRGRIGWREMRDEGRRRATSWRRCEDCRHRGPGVCFLHFPLCMVI